jgi:site-specific DNA recombinase
VPADRPAAALVPAIGYVRVSMMKEEAISPEIQKAAVARSAEAAGRLVVAWVEDLDKTGRNFKRKVQQAIGRIRAGEAGEIWLYRYDRWGRNTVESLANVYVVEQAAGRVISVTEPYDAETAIGKYNRTNAFALAEMQSDIIGENWKAVIASRVARQLPGTGGPRFGYVRRGRVRREDDPSRFRRDPQDGEERYEKDPATSPVLADAYHRYIAGDGRSALLRWMNGTGARTVRGGRFGWRALFMILDSGFGAGLLRVHDPDCRCGGSLGACRNEAFAKGAHEPVISVTTWEAYRRRRLEMRPQGPRLHDPVYPLAGLVRCGTCRYRMSVSHAGRRPGFGYRCQRNVQHLGCPGVWVQRAVLEAAVKAEVAKWAEDVESAAEAGRGRAAARDRARADVDALEREIARTDRAVAKTVRDQSLDEETPSSFWESARKEHLAERARLEKALEAARRARAREPAEFAPVAAGILESWDRVPAGRLRELLKLLVREVRVTRTGVRVPPDIRVIPVWEPEEDLEHDREGA